MSPWPPFQIVPLGDAAVLVQFEPRIDPVLHRAVIALRAALEQTRPSGCTFVMPAYCSLAVGFEPQRVNSRAIGNWIERQAQTLSTGNALEGADSEVTVQHTIGVCYSPACGLDLEVLARKQAIPVSEIVRRHTAIEYRAYMLGFLPGFAYLGEVDPRIAFPRHATPRTSVPAGSIGIAGRQTGIYPAAAPGGWQIIGRTPLSMLKPTTEPPFRIGPGDRVRFEAIDEQEFKRLQMDGGVRESSGSATPEHPTVEVVQPGMLTTVQDGGRPGHRAWGVPQGGALDRAAAAEANACVGNPANAAVLEITLLGPRLRFLKTCRIALAGANLSPTVDGMAVEAGRSITISAGSEFRFGKRVDGCRAYLAIAGHWDVPRWLGSTSPIPSLREELVPASTLRAGDRLDAGGPLDGGPPVSEGTARTAIQGEAIVTILPGPEIDRLVAHQRHRLVGDWFTVAPSSNRMGLRLRESIGPAAGPEMISAPVVPGTIQIPPSGNPAVLMRDAHTSGGYPRAAVVRSAELDALAQLRPGDRLRFRWA